jgi:hypothetical protein
MSRSEQEFKDFVRRLLVAWMSRITPRWYEEMVNDAQNSFRIRHEPYPGIVFVFEGEPGSTINGRVSARNLTIPQITYEGIIVRDDETGLQTKVKWRN